MRAFFEDRPVKRAALALALALLLHLGLMATSLHSVAAPSAAARLPAGQLYPNAPPFANVALVNASPAPQQAARLVLVPHAGVNMRALLQVFLN